ncbi:hypothetical protein T265_11770 [Opisthorchis viverrini]|uniref:Uncharacterized protein n=1 Tax=Opisthorchis viverrini TaxID=6198 RepID=A0A074Z8A2_OPIVI|nr:hypothetical protein T265_11770 [Opisthorchis viverrini]KER19465.1 hypothetical protein T265_11770 [Opisthorchis viverrini]
MGTPRQATSMVRDIVRYGPVPPSMAVLLSQPPHPLDSPLTVLDSNNNLLAPACNAQLPLPPPKVIGEQNCGSYNHCTTNTRLLQLTTMMMMMSCNKISQLSPTKGDLAEGKVIYRFGCLCDSPSKIGSRRPILNLAGDVARNRRPSMPMTLCWLTSGLFLKIKYRIEVRLVYIDATNYELRLILKLLHWVAPVLIYSLVLAPKIHYASSRLFVTPIYVQTNHSSDLLRDTFHREPTTLLFTTKSLDIIILAEDLNSWVERLSSVGTRLCVLGDTQKPARRLALEKLCEQQVAEKVLCSALQATSVKDTDGKWDKVTKARHDDLVSPCSASERVHGCQWTSEQSVALNSLWFAVKFSWNIGWMTAPA